MSVETRPAETSPTLNPLVPLRRRSKVPVAIVAVVILAAGTMTGAVLGARHAERHWRPLYDRAVTDYDRAVTEVGHWKSSSENWQQSRRQINEKLLSLQARISTSVGDLTNPHFVLWNSCGASGPATGCPLTPGHEYVGGVPDTFTYYVSFRSTVPVTVKIMSTSNFVCWESGNCTAHWVEWANRTNLKGGVFHDAEGCAGYIAVFTSTQPGILYPNISITRNPAPNATGACS
jgi:hypothetical protein